MTTEAEFRAKHDARVIEAMAEALFETCGDSRPWKAVSYQRRESWRAFARAALAAYRAAMWMPMSEAPEDNGRTVLVMHYGDGGEPGRLYPALAYFARYANGMRRWETLEDETVIEPIACQPIPLPPTEEPK